MNQKTHCCNGNIQSNEDLIELTNPNMTEYCALCSMAVKDKSIKLFNSKQGVKYFCCNTCKNKFDAFYSNIKI